MNINKTKQKYENKDANKNKWKQTNKLNKENIFFLARQGLTLVLRIFTKENQESRSSNLKICLMMFDILILKILYFFLYFHKFIWNKTLFIDLLRK